jgi:TPR repeat protein
VGVPVAMVVALLSATAFAEPADAGRAPVVTVQASGPGLLPSLVLPPAASTSPPMFVSLMQMGDSALVRGDIARARALYERAASVHPGAAAACIASGKTYDPNVLPLFGASAGSFANVARAREWYERAHALGAAEAVGLLAGLPP